MPRKYDLSKPGDLRRWTQSIQKDIQKEFDREAKRNPIRMPLQVEPTRPPHQWENSHPTVVNHTYNGPVVNGDGSRVQFATNIQGNVNQKQSEKVKNGYEEIAQLVDRVLQIATSFELNETERKYAEEEAESVLAEVTKESPDNSVISRGLAAMRGFLSPLVMGLNEAVTDESKEVAASLIREIGEAIQALS